MFPTFKTFQKTIFFFIAFAAMAGLIAFTEIRQDNKQVRAVHIQLKQPAGQRFLTERDVRSFLTRQGNDPLVGKAYEEINFTQLEKRLMQNGLVSHAEVGRDLAGNLLVEVQEPRPLARLVGTSSYEGYTLAGRYVSESGRFFPTSMNYTARVPLLSGNYFLQNRSLSATRNKPLLTLLQKIDGDSFFKALIAEIKVDENGYVTLWPQIGQQQIELGSPVNLDAKFKKIKLFYTDVIPLKGWNYYHRVNVQYQNQLVCE